VLDGDLIGYTFLVMPPPPDHVYFTLWTLHVQRDDVFNLLAGVFDLESGPCIASHLSDAIVPVTKFSVSVGIGCLSVTLTALHDSSLGENSFPSFPHGPLVRLSMQVPMPLLAVKGLTAQRMTSAPEYKRGRSMLGR
jgi:hypothetical protein